METWDVPNIRYIDSEVQNWRLWNFGDELRLIGAQTNITQESGIANWDVKEKHFEHRFEDRMRSERDKQPLWESMTPFDDISNDQSAKYSYAIPFNHRASRETACQKKRIADRYLWCQSDMQQKFELSPTSLEAKSSLELADLNAALLIFGRFAIWPA